MNTRTLRLLTRDRVAVIVGTVVALALGGCSLSSTGPTPTGSVALWVANFATIQGYTTNQLVTSRNATPDVLLSTGASNVTAVTFDASGNLWAAELGAVVEYTAGQLAAKGSPSPAVVLTTNDTSLNGAIALAFDARGNLWVANGGIAPVGANTLVEFTASQLAASGSPTPAVTLSASAGSINSPAGLAFDHDGNLWMTNSPFPFGTGASDVVEFSAGQLVASGSPVPAVTLSPGGFQFLGLAFDDAGNLWVANHVGSAVEFAHGQIERSGSPAPAVILKTKGSNPVAVAFDRHANLWVANGADGQLLKFGTNQIIASGSPTPIVTMSSGSLDAVSDPSALVFAP